jgi:hypothetical protein
VIEAISDPGYSDSENEDRFGWDNAAAFVIDGATPLAPPLIAPPHSDAAWLAEFAREFFLQSLASELPGNEIVRSLNGAAREYYRSQVRAEVEPYQYPVAAFQALRIIGCNLETMGLADCSLFIKDALGQCARWTGVTSSGLVERQNADQKSVSQPSVGGLHDERVLAALRTRRATYSSGVGPWALGLEPAAADHVAIENIAVRLPALAVLCTDGFAAAVDCYELYTIETMIAAAEKDGLNLPLRELRRIERDLDPDGSLFPRFKRSDDATAILFAIKD